MTKTLNPPLTMHRMGPSPGDNMTRAIQPESPYQLSPKEQAEFHSSIAGWILDRSNGLATEICDDYRKKMSRMNINFDSEGLTIPMDRALTVTHGAGGALLDTEIFDIERALRPASAVGWAGARFILGVQGPQTMDTDGLPVSTVYGSVAIPVELTKITMNWLPNLGTITAADGTWVQEAGSPNRLGGSTTIDKQLIAQSSPDAIAELIQSMRDAIADTIDQAAIRGAGTMGEPTGLYNRANVQQVTFGAAASLAKVVSFEQNITTNNGVDENIRFLANTNVRAKWKQIARAATITLPLWMDDDTILGKKARVTNAVAANNICAGQFDKMLIPIWGTGGAMHVTVDPYTASTSGQTKITVEAFADVMILRADKVWCINNDSAIQ